MSTASASVVRRVSVTWHVRRLGDQAHRRGLRRRAGWRGQDRSRPGRRPCGSSRTPPAWRVCRCSSPAAARRKNSSSFGLAPGQPPSMYCHAEVVELLGDPQLVLDGERQALLLAAVAQGGVVDVDRGRAMGGPRSEPGACARAPGRQLTCSTQSLYRSTWPAHGRLVDLLDPPGDRPGPAVADDAVVDRPDRHDLGGGAGEERLLGDVEVRAQDVAHLDARSRGPGRWSAPRSG